MANIIANWAVVSGFTAATSTTLSVVGTYSRNLGTITSATFTLTRSGVTRNIVVTSRTLSQPSDSNAPNPLLNGARQVSPFLGYHAVADLTPFSDGPVAVTCRLITSDGKSKTLSGMTVLNNTNGTLPRLSFRASAYVSPTGNDLNAGTRASPFRSIYKALYYLTGDGTGGTELGGGNVYLMAGDHEWLGVNSAGAAFTTTQDYWVNIQRDPLVAREDARIGSINANGVLLNSGSVIRIKFTELTFTVGIPYQTVVNKESYIWYDGCSFQSIYGRLDMREFRWAARLNTPIASSRYAYVTSCSFLNVGNGPAFRDLIRDVFIDGSIGIQFQISGGSDWPTNSNRAVINAVSHTQRMNAGVGGWSPPVVNASYVVTKNTAAGTATITNATVGGPDLRTFNEAGVQFGFYINISRNSFASASGWNNSNQGQFLITATGVLPDGRTWMTVANPSAVAETTGSNTAISLVWDPHPDVIQLNGSGFSNIYAQGIRVYDFANSQGYFGGGQQISSFCLENCTSNNGNNWFVRGPLTDFILRHCTFDGTWLWGEECVYTDLEITNNIFHQGVGYVRESTGGSANNPSAVAAILSPFATNNHFTTGTTFGANATTGPVGSITSTTGNFEVPPSSAAYHSAILLDIPATQVSNPPTRGVWRNAATGIWGSTSLSQTVTADSLTTSVAVQPVAIGSGQGNSVISDALATVLYVPPQEANVSVDSLSNSIGVYNPVVAADVNVRIQSQFIPAYQSIVLYEPTVVITTSGNVDITVIADDLSLGSVVEDSVARVDTVVVSADLSMSAPINPTTTATSARVIGDSLDSPLVQSSAIAKVDTVVESADSSLFANINNPVINTGFGVTAFPETQTTTLVVYDLTTRGSIIINAGNVKTVMVQYEPSLYIKHYGVGDVQATTVALYEPSIYAGSSVSVITDPLSVSAVAYDTSLALDNVVAAESLSLSSFLYAPQINIVEHAGSVSSTVVVEDAVVVVDCLVQSDYLYSTVVVQNVNVQAGGSILVVSDIQQVSVAQYDPSFSIGGSTYADLLSGSVTAYDPSVATRAYGVQETVTTTTTVMEPSIIVSTSVEGTVLEAVLSYFPVTVVAGDSITVGIDQQSTSLSVYEPVTTQSCLVISDTAYCEVVQNEAIGDNSVRATFTDTPIIGLEQTPFSVSADYNQVPAHINTGLARDISQIISIEQPYSTQWRITFEA